MTKRGTFTMPPLSDDVSVDEDLLFEEINEREHRVRIARLDPMSKQWIFHGWLEPNEAKQSRVSAIFGGGKYRVQLLRQNEHGQGVIQRTRNIELPGRYYPPEFLPGTNSMADRQSREPTMSGTPQTGEIGTKSQVGGTLRDMAESVMFDKLLQQLKPPTPIIETLTPLIAALVPVFEKLLDKKPDTGAMDSFKDELRSLKELLNGRPQTPMEQSIAVMREVLGLRRELTEEAAPRSSEDKLLDIGEKLLPVLLANKQQPQAPVTNQLPPGQEPVTPVIDPNAPMYEQLLRTYGPNLIQLARMGLSPESAVELTLKLVPQHLMGVLEEFVKRPDAAVVIPQVVPGLKEFDGWTKAYVIDMAKTLGEEDEEAEP